MIDVNAWKLRVAYHQKALLDLLATPPSASGDVRRLQKQCENWLKENLLSERPTDKASDHFLYGVEMDKQRQRKVKVAQKVEDRRRRVEARKPATRPDDAWITP